MIVSLLGLPGAGKSTLGAALRRALGWSHFRLGEQLRRRAEFDLTLRQQLQLGELAPEHIVLELVERALAEGQRPLVLDGFPRHAEQLSPLVGRPDWVAVHLRLPKERALDRLQRRLTCDGCGHPLSETDSGMTCDNCGGKGTTVRADDRASVWRDRVDRASESLTRLLSVLEGDSLVSVCASQSREQVVEEALALLPGHSQKLGISRR